MQLLRRLSFTMLFMSLMTLVACGGGDGDLTGGGTGGGTGGTGGTDPDTTLSISISDTNVTEQNPATLSVTVLTDGDAVVGEVVTFTTSLGSFLPESGTALTGDDGIATIVLNGGDISGAGTVTAGISSSESASVGFTTQAPSEIVLRVGSGTPFSEGNISISLSPLSAGGTSVISASLVDAQDQLYTEPAEFIFTSLCSSQATPSASLDSPVATSEGKVESIYFAKGCVGYDPITVNVVVNGQNLSATGSIEVLSADIGSIVFVSATPEHIAIQGAGNDERPEGATVIFKVLDTNSNPVSNKNVSFSLNSTVGGIVLNPVNATTNNEGLVQTVVNSGAVARTVRVLANVDDSSPIIQTQSSELKISTGIPDQDSMSISASNLAPRAWDHNGVEVTLTARLADAFNNPPPATAVYFTTEGGSIENLDASCTTGDDGSCTVIWRSQSPKPDGHELGDVNNPNHVPETVNTMGQQYGGRVTILATTIGEESFPDLNGNGRFDVCEMPAFIGGIGKPCLGDGSVDESGDFITYSGNDVSGRPYDIGEAYADYNEDGVFNQEAGFEAGGELEELVDFNQNGVYDGKDGKYNGILCAIPTHSGCAEKTSLDIQAQMVIVMSGDTPYICINSSQDNGTIDDEADTTLNTDIDKFTKYSATSRQFCENSRDTVFTDKQHRAHDDNLFLGYKASGNVTITMADLHNQPMPEGTEVSFKSSVGSITSEIITWKDNINGGMQFTATIKAGQVTESGTLDVILTFKDGDTLPVRVANIFIQ